MGNPGTPQLEIKEYRPFDEHAGIGIIVCHRCGKANPENVFCDCPAGRAVAEMHAAVLRNDWDRVAEIRTEALKRSGKPIREQMERKAAALFNSIGAPVEAGHKHTFSALSDRCMMCGMTRQAATDLGIAACTQMVRKTPGMFEDGFDEKMVEDAVERLVGELVRLPNGMIGSRRELNAYFDDFKARHRAEKRAENRDRIAAPAIALMERQGTALAAAFAVPVVPTIETLSASPPAAKLLPYS